MKKLLSTLGLLIAAGMVYAKDVEYGKYIYEYEAGTYKVLMLRYGPESDNQVLIKVSGIDNEQDGKIYLHTKACDTTRCDSYKYITKEVHYPDGTQWFTIYNPGGWYNGNILQPYLVEPDKENKLYMSEKSQTDLDPNMFVANYKKQQGIKK